jgi:hypothetical protein
VRWIAFAIVCIALTVGLGAHLGRPKPVSLTPPPLREGDVQPDLEMGRIRDHLKALTRYPTRITGSVGCQQAEAEIVTRLRAMGIADVATQEFSVPVPRTADAQLTAAANDIPVEIPLFPLWPNLASTCQTPPEGLAGHLVYAGGGSEADLSGKAITGAIVILDWTSDLEWLSAPEFGARAVVFRGDDAATCYTARNKFLTVPANIPRFYVAPGDLDLLDACLETPDRDATVHCATAWEPVIARNIIAQISAPSNEQSQAGSPPAAIVFHAYYDSISVVPDAAPGAEQACGAAVLLEFCRFLHNQAPADRPIYALFTSGHGQAFYGMTHFVSELRKTLEADAPDPASMLTRMGRPGLLVSLDLSSRSDRYGVFAVGRFRAQAEHKIRPKFSVLGAELAQYAASFRSEDEKDTNAGAFVDCINLTRGRHWWTYFPYQAPFESELAVVAGIPAVTLATVNDDRRYVDTPGDRFSRLRLDLLEQQVTARKGRRAGLGTIAKAITEWTGPFVSSPLTDAWASLKGRVVWLDQERNYTPNEPLTEAVVFLKTQRGDKHLMGTRGIPAVMTDPEGRFTFNGLIQITENSQFRNCLLEAYGVASPRFLEKNAAAVSQFQDILSRGEGAREPIPPNGAIMYAVDMARQKDYPWTIEIRKAQQHLNIVCFPCRAVTLTGLTDPRGYLPLKDLTILEAATLAQPFQFGKSATDALAGDDSENMVTLWADPTTRVMLTLGLGFQERRLILINNTLEDPEGEGFVLDDLQTIPSMVLQGARDMWQLDEHRMAKLESNGVKNPRLESYHRDAEEHLATATEALANGDYRTYRTASEKGWALEGKAYAEILAMINNMIRGVLFYLALLLPFSYCLERLLIASGTIKRRIIWISVIFSICFLLLAAVHPAFRFTLTPFLVLLAFIIMALVATVSVLIVVRMDAVLQERKQVATGRHDDQQNVGGIAVRAVDLGISNIRRRPQRAFLTGLTVVMVTFILLSFTSLVPVVSISRLNHPDGTPSYRGLLTRDRAWGALPRPLHESLKRNFEPKSGMDTVVAARAWFFSDRSGQLSQIDLTPTQTPGDAGADTQSFTAVALLCVEPSEPAVTGVDRTLVAGRWFEHDGERAIILPLHVAEQLGLGTEDIGQSVRLFGQDLPLVGIIDPAAFDAIRDIDGEPLTPVNFVMQQQMQAQQSGDEEQADTLEEYVHYATDQIAIVPYQFGIRLGATTRSIAVRGGRTTDLSSEAEGYTTRSNLTILACDGTDVILYAALETSQLSAAWQIAVPLFLGFVMVLGTMMGSVYERQREIFVYNSVGLSPGNVSALFLAESSVYAVVGAGFGYLLGQAVSRLFQATGWLSGLSLNYTAGSAVFVTVLTMAIVLVSTIYPARQAFHAAIPDADRETTEDDRDADTSSVALFLPFVASPANVLAMQAYMAEFLRGIEGVTIGQLAVDDLICAIEKEHDTETPALLFRAWMAPFDLGVSHDTKLRIVFREDRGVYQYHLTATRFSGDDQNWRRLVPRFISTIRKQLLMWRVLSNDDVAKYQREGDRLFQ